MVLQGLMDSDSVLSLHVSAEEFSNDLVDVATCADDDVLDRYLLDCRRIPVGCPPPTRFVRRPRAESVSVLPSHNSFTTKFSLEANNANSVQDLDL